MSRFFSSQNKANKLHCSQMLDIFEFWMHLCAFTLRVGICVVQNSYRPFLGDFRLRSILVEKLKSECGVSYVQHTNNLNHLNINIYRLTKTILCAFELLNIFIQKMGKNLQPAS